MTDRERLLKLARDVRETLASQERYFKGRAPADLAASKQWERHLRRAVAEILDDRPTLFGGDDDQK